MKIQAINFLSWKNLEFEVENSITLIDGWNEDDQTSEGSGKSAILNAYSWGCYGKLPKDVKVDEVIKRGEKTCAVSITFDDGSSVVRTRKPNDVYLLINGEQKRGKDAKETQQMIEEHLGLTFETFCQTIYFAQNYDKKFITANQEDKGKILSEIQDIKIFDKARDIAHTKYKEVESKITSIKSEVVTTNHQIEMIKKDIEHSNAMYLQQIQTKEQTIKRLESDVQNSKLLVDDANSKLKGFEEEKVALQYELYNLEKSQETLRTQMSEIDFKASSIRSEISQYDFNQKSRVSKHSQAELIGQRYRQLDAEKQGLQEFIKNPTKDCPTCGTKLEGCDTSHAKSRIHAIDAEMAQSMDILKSISEELSIPINDPVELKSQLEELMSSRQTLASQITAQTTKINDIKQKLSQEAVLLSLKSTYENQHKDHEKSLENMKLMEIPKPNLQEFEEKLKYNNDKLQKMDESLENLNTLINSYSELKDGFREVKSYIFNSVLAEINMRTNEYLSKLFEVPCEIRFTNDNMKIETTIIMNGEETSIGLLSGGQFRRVSLAIDLSLSDITLTRKNSRTNLMVLDEYFKDLSESSMEKCLMLLQERTTPVLLIEHNSIFKSIVNNTFSVRLENGTSMRA